MEGTKYLDEGQAKSLAERLRKLFKVHTRVVLYHGRYVVRTSYDKTLLKD